MSALGQKRTHAVQQRMSALGQKRTFERNAPLMLGEGDLGRGGN